MAFSATAFARHETFHPRFGWLKKGVNWAIADPSVFTRDDAPIRLGVGKNMVRSLRYWCHAFKLLEGDRPTPFGLQLLGDTGWDAFLEDPASLWLLHWKLLEPPCHATTWDFVFNHFRLTEFSTEELFNQLCEYRDRIAPRTAESSLRKDINCLLRMYTQQPSKSGKASVSEDSLDCPFAELGLIYPAGNSRTYGFRVGHKPTLPANVVVYACLQYADRAVPGQSRIPVGKLLYDPGSPGQVFRLTESALDEAIATVAKGADLGMSDAAGKRELFFTDAPLQQSVDILDTYYEAR
ncbi:MAG: DUF4007 family protein [Cyanobacteriota bacterium]